MLSRGLAYPTRWLRTFDYRPQRQLEGRGWCTISGAALHPMKPVIWARYAAIDREMLDSAAPRAICGRPGIKMPSA